MDGKAYARNGRYAQCLCLLPARDEEVVQRSENQRDVPAPREALNKSQAEGAPAQQFKSRKKDRQRSVIDRQARKEQIAEHAQNIRNRQEPAQGHTKREYGNGPRPCEEPRGNSMTNDRSVSSHGDDPLVVKMTQTSHRMQALLRICRGSLPSRSSRRVRRGSRISRLAWLWSFRTRDPQLCRGASTNRPNASRRDCARVP